MDVIDVLSLFFILSTVAIPFIMQRIEDPMQLAFLMIPAFFAMVFAYIQGTRYSATTAYKWDDRIWTIFIFLALADIFLIIVKMSVVSAKRMQEYVEEGI